MVQWEAVEHYLASVAVLVKDVVVVFAALDYKYWHIQPAEADVEWTYYLVHHLMRLPKFLPRICFSKRNCQMCKRLSVLSPILMKKKIALK